MNIMQRMGRKGGQARKNYSPEEIEARTQRLAAARAKRWAGHEKLVTKVVTTPKTPRNTI
jgi:hypothetical protein